MRSEVGGIDPVTIIVVVLFIALIAGVVVWALRDRSKRFKELQAFAEEHAWSMSGDDNTLCERLEAQFPKQVYSISRVVTIERGIRNLRLFDCQQAYLNRSKSLHNRTGCVIESSAFEGNGAGAGAVVVLERDGVDSMWAPDQFDLGQGEFTKRFVAGAKDQTAAHQVLTPTVQALLLSFSQSPNATNFTVGITEAGAAVMIGRDAPPERMLELIDLCRALETAMPGVHQKYVPN